MRDACGRLLDAARCSLCPAVYKDAALYNSQSQSQLRAIVTVARLTTDQLCPSHVATATDDDERCTMASL